MTRLARTYEEEFERAVNVDVELIGKNQNKPFGQHASKQQMLGHSTLKSQVVNQKTSGYQNSKHQPLSPQTWWSPSSRTPTSCVLHDDMPQVGHVDPQVDCGRHASPLLAQTEGAWSSSRQSTPQSSRRRRHRQGSFGTASTSFETLMKSSQENLANGIPTSQHDFSFDVKDFDNVENVQNGKFLDNDNKSDFHFKAPLLVDDQFPMKSNQEMNIKEEVTTSTALGSPTPRSRATTSTSTREEQDVVEATVWMLDEFVEEQPSRRSKRLR